MATASYRSSRKAELRRGSGAPESYALIQGAEDPLGIRRTAPEIEAYLLSLMP